MTRNRIIPPDEFVRDVLREVKKAAEKHAVSEEELTKLAATMFFDSPMPQD